jgi:hypothetical protein
MEPNVLGHVHFEETSLSWRVKTMKRSSYNKALPFAAAIAFAFAGNASFADMASYRQLEQGVISDLAGLAVNTDLIGMLTMAELTNLAAILEGSTTGAEKTDAANKLIADATSPPERIKANEGRAQIAANVMAELEALGLALPTSNRLSPSQLARVAVIMDSDRTDANKKTAAEVVLAENLPAPTPFGKSGVMQLEEQLMGQLESVGIAPPAPGSLSLSQVAELTVIFDGMDDDTTKKDAAMKVLSGT